MKTEAPSASGDYVRPCRSCWIARANDVHVRLSATIPDPPVWSVKTPADASVRRPNQWFLLKADNFFDRSSPSRRRPRNRYQRPADLRRSPDVGMTSSGASSRYGLSPRHPTREEKHMSVTAVAAPI